MNFFYNKKRNKNNKFFKFRYRKFWKKNSKKRKDKDDYRYSWYNRIQKHWMHDRWPHKTYIQNFYSYGHKRELRVKFRVKPFLCRSTSFSYFYQLYNRFFSDIICEVRVNNKKFKKITKFFFIKNILKKSLTNLLIKSKFNVLKNNLLRNKLSKSSKSLKKLKILKTKNFWINTKNYVWNFKSKKNSYYLKGFVKKKFLIYKNPYIFLLKTPQYNFKTQQYSMQRKMRFIHAPCWKNQFNNKNRKFFAYNNYNLLYTKYLLKKYFNFLIKFKSIVILNNLKNLSKKIDFYMFKKRKIKFNINRKSNFKHKKKRKMLISLIRKQNRRRRSFKYMRQCLKKQNFLTNRYLKEKYNKKINISIYFKMRKLNKNFSKIQFLNKKNYLNNFSFIRISTLKKKKLNKYSKLWFFIFKKNINSIKKTPFIISKILWKRLQKNNKLIYSFFNNLNHPFRLHRHVKRIFHWRSKHWLFVLRYAKKFKKITKIYKFFKHKKRRKIRRKIKFLHAKKKIKVNKNIESMKKKNRKAKFSSPKMINFVVKKKAVFSNTKKIKKMNSTKKKMCKKFKKKLIKYRIFKKKKNIVSKSLIRKIKKYKKINKKKRYLFYQKFKTIWQTQTPVKKYITHKKFKTILKSAQLIKHKCLDKYFRFNFLIFKYPKKICKKKQKIIKKTYYRIKFKYITNLYRKKKFKKFIYKYLKNSNQWKKNSLFFPVSKYFKKFYKILFGRVFLNKKKFFSIQKRRFFIKKFNLFYYNNWNINLIFNDKLYYRNQLLSFISEKLDYLKNLKKKIQKGSNSLKKNKTISNTLISKYTQVYRTYWHKLWDKRIKINKSNITSVIPNSKFQRKSQSSFFATIQHLQYLHETCAWTSRLFYTWGIQGYSPLKKTRVHLGEIEPKYWVQNIMRVIRISTSRRMKYFIKEFKNISLPTEVVRDYELKEEIVEYIDENWKLYFKNAYDYQSQKQAVWEALNIRWRDLSKKPWFEQLLLPRSFYNKLNYFRMWRKKKSPLQTKKNKIYNLFNGYFYKRYNSAIYVSRKEYFRFSQILFKILLPFYGHCHTKRFRKLAKKYQFKKTHSRESISNITEYFERRLDIVVYKLNFAPTIKIARDLIKYGFFTVDCKEQKNPAFIINNYSIIQVKNKKRWALLIKRGFTAQRKIYKKTIPLNMLLNSKLLAGLILDNPRQTDLKKNERVNKYFLKHARLL